MLRPLGQLEQEIMDVLWKKREGSVRDVVKQLLRKKDIAYTTVLTVMNRLVEKGFLRRAENGVAFVYSPVESQEKFLQSTFKKFFSILSRDFGKDVVARQFMESMESLDPAVAKKLFKQSKRK